MVENFQLKSTVGVPLYWYGAKDNNIPGGFRISNDAVTQGQTTPANLSVNLDAGKTGL
jgi:hypothetical protein